MPGMKARRVRQLELRRLLKIAIPAILILSFLCPTLPKDTIAGISISSVYTFNLMMLALLVSFALSIKLAYTYEGSMSKTFTYLAAYFLIILLANLDVFWDVMTAALSQQSYIPITYTSIIIARVAYIPLALSRIHTVRFIKVRSMNIYEKLIVMSAIILIFAAVMYPYISLIFFSESIAVMIPELMKPVVAIRLVDFTMVSILLPLLLLNLHQYMMPSRERVTLSIGAIVGGIIMSMIVDYPYTVITGLTHAEMALTFRTGTLYDSLLVLSYLIVVLGLYVQMNYDELAQREFEKEIAGEIGEVRGEVEGVIGDLGGVVEDMGDGAGKMRDTESKLLDRFKKRPGNR